MNQPLSREMSQVRTKKHLAKGGYRYIYVTTYNQNNPSVFSTIKATFEALCGNKVVGMKDYILIQSRRQPANLKKILTKAEFSSKPPMVTKCGDKRCECCNHLLLSNHYVFKEVNYKFTLKSPMSCGSYNLIYLIL